MPRTIEVKVIPKASKNLVKEQEGFLKVYLTKPAQDNLANLQLIELLSGYLKVKKYQLRIISGQKCRKKIIEIDATG